MSPAEEIDEILSLSEACDLRWSAATLNGRVRIQAGHLDILRKLNESDNVEVEVRRHGLITALASVTADQEIDVSIMPPRGARYCLAKDQQDLLSIFNLNSLPEDFALMDSGFRTWRQIDSVGAPAVLIASRLIKRLESDAIIEVSGSRFVLMTYDNKIYLSHSVSMDVIARSLTGIEKGCAKLEQLLSDALHGAEKKRIIRNSIIASLKSCDESSRLSHLLAHCDEIFENAQHNYELFVSNFSFQNDLDRLNEQKRDFSVKLNGLLIGIQGKLLAIPVSTILATTQLKDSTDPNYITINLSVVVSSFIFLVIIFWLIRSQMIAINSIKYEIEQKEKRFRVELPKIFQEVEMVFDSLKADCGLNIKMAWSLIVLSFVLTFITLHVFLLRTFDFSMFSYFSEWLEKIWLWLGCKVSKILIGIDYISEFP
ncbi:TPA: hypothetical protein NH024_002122 [Pseudomonas aeruginosa]|nr:hypothetical protein [Pseudomonas aeruginosa]HCE9444739.1 hypothetical protein [Pseudomonas aeruginosa]